MKIIKKLIILIFFTISFILSTSSTHAINIDYNIDAINENKYPGIKNQIKELQNQFPNWRLKVVYTGLNWKDVIAGEYVGHESIPSNLVQNTYNGEWICPICKDKLYDVTKDWYCASEKAIAYMMDPRNSLTKEYIFQFQDLSSSAGKKSEISKMVEGTFLNNKECIDAIITAAKAHNISPFHLVARIRQEQGVDGSGSMNGYIYTTKEGKNVTVYNLFNIKVSGNSEEGFKQGAKFAYEQGWTSKAASIIGGAKFLREKYLDKGQTTLYFQKYNVVDKNNLYNNQYMQNINAARSEGNIVYNGYKNNGMIDSHFEFTIPLYENMPTINSKKPLSNVYIGNINSELKTFNVSKNYEGATYVNGEIVVVEWIDGISTVPNITPKMRFKSTDGKINMEVFVKSTGTNTYYFDRFIEGIDASKQYYFEIELLDTKNISENKSMNVYFSKTKYNNTVVGIYRDKRIRLLKQNILFEENTYIGNINSELINIKVSKNYEGAKYIHGQIVIVEWVDGKSTVPKITPKMRFKSTDGEVDLEVFIKATGTNTYYYDRFIEGIDKSKEYYLEVESGDKKNISNNKRMKIYLAQEKALF